MSTQLEIVTSESHRQAQSSANNRIDEYEDAGFELVDQEIDAESRGVTVLLVFESAE